MTDSIERAEERGALADRNAAIAREYADPTKKVADIGRRYGISYQRVREIARNQGVAPRQQKLTVNAKRAEQILEENPLIASAGALAEAVGASVPALRRALNAAGITERVNILLWERRKELAKGRAEATREQILDAMRALADRLGYTPGTHELNAEGSGTPAHTTYVKHFGSLKEAQIAAGLTPNSFGAPGHARSKLAAAADTDVQSDVSAA